MTNFKIYMLSFVVMLFFGSCDTRDTSGQNAQAVSNTDIAPVSAKNKVIYEINVRNYSSAGNFEGVQKDLARLKDLGVDILWLMPIHPIGEVNRAGSLGSPYSIKDYKAVNPEFGTAQDFKNLVDAAHALKIEIWMDWVGNHTAWDHPWVTSNIDYYSSQNGQQPYSPNGWNDVAQLDYSNPAMRAEMIDAMKYWVQNFNIDGYRCDAATLYIPVDFWVQAREQVNAIKKITWLNEGDNPAYMVAFDYDYAWGYSNVLNTFGTGSDITNLVAESVKLFNNPNYKDKGRMVYIANHDLNAHDGTEFTRYGANVLPLTVLSYTIYDLPLINNGQEIGMNKSISLFEKDPLVWDPVNKIHLDLHKKLVRLKKTQPALEDGINRGAMKVLPINKPNVFAYTRTRGNNEILVVLNFNNVAVNYKFEGTAPSGEYTNYLTGEQKTFSANEGNILMEKGYAVYVKN